MSARPLTVVQALPALDGGGVERGVVEVGEALVREGHRSIVISGPGRLAEELRAGGSEHVEWNIGAKSPLTLRYVKRLRDLLRELDADVVHARSRVPAWMTLLAWRKMDPKTRPRFVTSVHGLHSVSRYSAVMTRGEAVEAVSRTVVGYIRENYPKTDMSRVRLIERGVSPEAFPHGYAPSEAWLRDWREAHPQLEGKRVITLVGRLTRLKGHADLIALVQNLKSRGAPAHALIVGGEDPRRRAYARELRRIVRTRDLEADVTFAGHRSDIREVYAASDVVVSLSNKPESFGRSVLEALRLGVPVLGYDHGGVGEVLREVYPPGAVPLGDKAALADRAHALITGERAVVPLTDKYTLEAMLEKTLAMYEELARAAAQA